MRTSHTSSRSVIAGVALAIVIAAGSALVLYSQGTIQVGYVLVTSQPGKPAPAGAALFSFTNNGVLVSQAGVGVTDPLLSGRIFVDEASVDTGFALVNPSTASASVDFVLRNAQGVEVGRQSRTILPRQHLSQFVDQLVPGVP